MELTQLLDADTPKKKEAASFYLLGLELSKMTDLDEDKKGEVFLQCLEVGKKVAKIADAVDEYHKLERRELKKLAKSAQNKNNHPDLVMSHDSTRLQAKVEEALSQAKSALDVAAKVLKPLVNIEQFTFGKKGKTVIGQLQNNIPAELKDRARPLVELIESNEAQLTAIIDYRDTQHFRNLAITPLRADGDGRHETPNMPDGQAVAEFMESLFNYMFLFLQDFLALAIYIRLYPGLVIVVQGDGRKREYRAGISNEAIQA